MRPEGWESLSSNDQTTLEQAATERDADREYTLTSPAGELRIVTLGESRGYRWWWTPAPAPNVPTTPPPHTATKPSRLSTQRNLRARLDTVSILSLVSLAFSVTAFLLAIIAITKFSRLDGQQRQQATELAALDRRIQFLDERTKAQEWLWRQQQAQNQSARYQALADSTATAFSPRPFTLSTGLPLAAPLPR